MPGLKTLAVALLAGSSEALRIPDAQQQPLGLAGNVNTASSAKPPKTLPLVDSVSLQAGISATRLQGHAMALFGLAMSSFKEYGHPTRVIGSPGHNATLDYIYKIVTKAGGGSYYNVSNQTFPAVSGSVAESRLVINGSLWAEAQPMGLTPPTPGKEPVFADLTAAAAEGCEAGDYDAATVKGSIVLVRRGSCPFGRKSELAGAAGALAVVVYNTEDGPLSGTLGTPTDTQVATFGVPAALAAPVLAALAAGETVDGIAYMDAVVSKILTKNILAQTVAGDPDNCVMLGGHSDSVSEGPGINDDGTGSLTLLEVATQLAKFNVTNCVRFAWWAAEEEGLLGSDYYAATLEPEENLKVRLFMDYDMLASPNFAYQVYDARDAENPAGSQALRDLYIDYYTAAGTNHTLIPFDGRSDYDGFIRAGIPAGGIATGAEGIKTEAEAAVFGGTAGQWYDPCYHQLCDNATNVNLTAWELNSKLVAHSVATYALSFEGFPNRTLEDITAAAARPPSKYRGSKLVM